MVRAVAVVPHTHWDREWYAPFEAYRARLIEMMDGLLSLLEAGQIDTFHLDGQVAIVDDYLEAVPEARPRLESLVAAGRLAVGPWYVLMDEFCVSGETILRNLQLGLERAASIGAAAGPDPLVGYLPDMFGHMAQMPQVLRQAGMSHAVVWRGVPAAIGTRAFGWRAPDGSRVRAEYLPVGYASGAFLPQDAPALVRRVAAHETEIEPFIGPSGPILLMNGGDHQPPQAWLSRVIQEANQSQDRFRFQQVGLARFLAGQTAGDADLPEWVGELRSGARAPLLMGVLSNRVDVKQAAAAAETGLERIAEPLAVLWLPLDHWPDRLFDRAWLAMIRNSAHDSICACSADEVVRAVLHRYDSARTIAEEISSSARAIAGVATAAAGTLVINSLASDRDGLIELDLPGVDPRPGTQQLSVTPAAVVDRHGSGRDLATLLGQLAAEGWLGPSGRPTGAALSDPSATGGPGRGLDSRLIVTLSVDATRPPEPETAPVMAEAWARAGAGRDLPLTVRVERAASQRVAALAEAVPGWGWALWSPGRASPAPVEIRESPLAIEALNGLVEVVVDRRTGTFAVGGVGGQNLIVEEADEGDTYNFSAAAGGQVRSAPDRVDLEVIESGPIRAVIRVRRVYPWEFGEVVSDVDVRSGDPAVRVTTRFHHTGRDHRIRAVFPLGAVAATTTAECAFATVTRSEAEGGSHEPALPTFPSRRFVTAGPLTVTHQGLLEHELVDGGRALAVTLLRATGILSRPAPPARPNVAGPALHLRDAQMPGPQVFRYALARDCSDPWALADSVWTPLTVLKAGGHGHLPDRGSRLRLSGGRVSSLRRHRGAIEIRVFNPDPWPTTVRIPDHAGTLVDLAGQPVGEWRDSFPLRPWGFATARLEAESLD